MASSGQGNFASGIRAAVRGLWLGVLSEGQFITTMGWTLEIGLTRAYNEGAESCGIEPDELTGDEIAERQQIIFEQMMWIGGFASVIAARSKANKGKLGGHLSRAQSWIGRYSQTRDIARTRTCGDKKLTWHLGAAEHCSSCLKLEGKTKRASQWEAADIYPQHPDLKCGGWRCACSLEPTDEPMSKGRLPGIP